MKEIQINLTVRVVSLDELTADDRELVLKAKDMTANSYSPYSNFKVGAALRLANGSIFCGSNQENASFPVGLCAERTAFCFAQANAPEQAPVAIAIAAFTGGAFLGKPVSPCGACRQALLEAETRYGRPIRVLLYGEDGIYIVDSVRDLLPLTFDGSEME